MKRQHGLLLLPVALALSVMGALAYAMTRGAADDASAVDAQYDLEATRYLAEAGLRLAKWQNEKLGCDRREKFTAVQLPGGAGTVTVNSITVKKEQFAATVTAESPRGALITMSRDEMMFFDRSHEDDLEAEVKDTYISSNNPFTAYGSSDELEATDGKAHILVSIPLDKIPKNARVSRTILSMYLRSSNSVQSVRELAVHAVTRNWSYDSATWVYPWIFSPGGSYNPQSETVVPIGGINQRYEWKIGALVRRWDNGTQENFGVLLKPRGLNGARFNSVNAGQNKLSVDIYFHRRCT